MQIEILESATIPNFEFIATSLILAQTDMPLKKTLPFILCFFCAVYCAAQQKVEKKNRINDQVTEIFTALKDSDKVKDGPYEAFYKRKTPIAMGNYTHGKKTGLWRFYDSKGKLMQIYNYDADSIRYEAREYLKSSNFLYTIDQQISDTDKVTKPIKIGGRYYGYLPYLGAYKVPFDPYIYGTEDCAASVQLLISPLGRLAEYKVRSLCSDYDRTITLDVKLFKDEDRKFIPATYNGKPVVSTIMIRCRLTRDGGLDFAENRRMQDAE